MKVQYLEIVTADVDATCEAFQKLHTVSFTDPDAGLGKTLTAPLPGGGKVGVRAPMHESEETWFAHTSWSKTSNLLPPRLSKPAVKSHIHRWRYLATDFTVLIPPVLSDGFESGDTSWWN